MTAALYEDAGLTLDEHGIAIRRYYFPMAGHKFPLDIHRGSKKTLLVLDVGARVNPCITPEDPDKVIELLTARVPVS
ncbi:MAG: hypothetical protein ACLPXZ_19470 [Mycobacterium sp.]